MNRKLRAVCTNKQCRVYGEVHCFHRSTCLVCDCRVVRFKNAPFRWWVSLVWSATSLVVLALGVLVLCGVRL